MFMVELGGNPSGEDLQAVVDALREDDGLEYAALPEERSPRSRGR
jgi:hypothetical protein